MQCTLITISYNFLQLKILQLKITVYIRLNMLKYTSPDLKKHPWYDLSETNFGKIDQQDSSEIPSGASIAFLLSNCQSDSSLSSTVLTHD